MWTRKPRREKKRTKEKTKRRGKIRGRNLLGGGIWTLDVC